MSHRHRDALCTALARYYDPSTGQFLTVDPAVANTLSPYGYVAGNPLNSSDASGLDPLSLLGGLIGGAAGAVMGGVGYGLSVASGQQSWSWQNFVGATVGGLVGGAVAGACDGTTLLVTACGAAGGFMGTLVTDAITGQPITAEGLFAGAAVGAAGGYFGSQLFPTRGFQPYKLSNLWDPGPNSQALYARGFAGGFFGFFVGGTVNSPPSYYESAAFQGC
jgi:hypothetical protein